jgi:hypothetical protein
VPSGGARPGAGRKRGSLTQKTREVAEKAVASGKALPLDVMLKAMGVHYDNERWDQAAAIAKDAAPYLHAKLASVEHSGPEGGPIRHIVTGVPRADDPT